MSWMTRLFGCWLLLWLIFALCFVKEIRDRHLALMDGKSGVKNLSDNALQLVLDLHNYSVINASFPGDITDMHLTYFHKRGIRTDLRNWRGLLISNFLANSPMTWMKGFDYLAPQGFYDACMAYSLPPCDC